MALFVGAAVGAVSIVFMLMYLSLSRKVEQEKLALETESILQESTILHPVPVCIEDKITMASSRNSSSSSSSSSSSNYSDEDNLLNEPDKIKEGSFNFS